MNIRIAHVALWVEDLERARSFYTQFFGFSANDKYLNEKKKFSSYFLSHENGVRLELMHRPDILDLRKEAEYLGWAHLAISVGSKKEVDTLTEQIRAAGFQVVGEPRTTGDGYYESVILDPENNRIELTV